MPSHFNRWKAWSQLVLRVNQYDGASDSNNKKIAIWSKMVRLDPTMMVSTEPKRQKAPDLNEGVKKATPVLGSVETHN